jgi:hypothetical protein
MAGETDDWIPAAPDHHVTPALNALVSTLVSTWAERFRSGAVDSGEPVGGRLNVAAHAAQGLLLCHCFAYHKAVVRVTYRIAGREYNLVSGPPSSFQTEFARFIRDTVDDAAIEGFGSYNRPLRQSIDALKRAAAPSAASLSHGT